MKKVTLLIQVIITIWILAFTHPGWAQQPIQVPSKTHSQKYLQLIDQLQDSSLSSTEKLSQLKIVLPEIVEPFERYYLIYWELPTRLSETGQFKEAFERLKSGQNEGLYYAFIMGQNIFPTYLSGMKDLDGFKDFIDENSRLRVLDQAKSSFEYIVRLPEAYSPGGKYPLMIVLYGGFGSHYQQFDDWRSPELIKNYITVYIQGDQCVGSFQHAYPRDNADQMKVIFEQIVEKYPVDTARVVIGAQSAGAHHAFKLCLDQLIPVKGILLAFPGTPQLNEEKLRLAALRGVRISMLAGGKDPRVEKTQELAVKLDSIGILNYLTVFPEKGHEFPDNFPVEIDRALNFILHEKDLNDSPEQ